MKTKDIRKLIRGIQFPQSLEEVKINRVVLGSELTGATVVGKTIEPNKYYKVTEKKLRRINTVEAFVKYCKANPKTDPMVLIDHYIAAFRKNHQLMVAKFPHLFKETVNEQG